MAIALDIRRAALPLWEALKLTGTLLARRARRRPTHYPQLIRRALERLGLTYLKLGQYMAMRLDLLPEELCEELSRLYEDIFPVGFQEIKETVETELQGPLAQFFREFRPEPVASASVAQVHEAWTCSNERVAVKVQRPGIQPIFAADMRNLRRAAALLDALGVSGTLSAKELIGEFARWTTRELDFVTEGRTADRLRRNATANEIVPVVYWDLTTPRVLTMQFIDGMSMGEIIALVRRGREDLILKRLPNIELRKAGHNMAYASLHQTLVCGFFHGDPHPGNVLILDDNSVAFVDFGIFGELSEYHREILAGYIESIAVGDIAAAFQYFAKLSTPTRLTNLEAFEQDASASIRAWYVASRDPYATFKERHMGTYFGRMLGAVRRHNLRIGIDTLLFWRAMAALDYNALTMSAHFNLSEELRGFFEQIRPGPVQRLLAVLEPDNFATSLLSGISLVRDSPGDLRQILSDVSEGRFELTARTSEGPKVKHVRNQRVRLLVTTILSVSVSLLFAAPELNAASAIYARWTMAASLGALYFSAFLQWRELR